MPLVVFFLVVSAAAALGYALTIWSAHQAIARGASPETTALRFLPEPIRRYAEDRLIPGWAETAPEAYHEWVPAEAAMAAVAAPAAPSGFAPPFMAPGQPVTAPPTWAPPMARPRGRPVRVRLPRAARRQSRHESRVAQRALRRAARADAPVALRVFSLVRLVLLLFLITLALTASLYLAATYVVSLFSRAVRS